ncbi:MAG TPA: hypothetical protein VMN81_01860 [Vicinamibacterales bacterium]|nr:hypothetical protein [Vicinamibacterales bacterium]
MRSAAAAFAWEFRQRHRWGLAGLVVYLFVLAAIKMLFLARGHAISFDNNLSYAFVVVVPVTATFLYFLAVFSFGLAGDLAARQSMYPARLFTLPVTTAGLAGWPMLYGTVAMALLWAAMRLFALWPPEFDVPMIWPALLAASMLAWLQALTWMPYPLPGLRVIVTVLWLTAIDAVVFIAVEFKVREPVMLALLAPHVPLAYLAARFAVGRARRGHVPDWRRMFRPLSTFATVLANRRESFPSAARAQVWFEWRAHGRSLPLLVAILLPFELGQLFIHGDTPKLVFYTLAVVLLTPGFMAGFVSATASTSNPPFLATRPLSSASLIAAKLTATIWSTAAAWLLVLAAVPLGLELSGTWPVVIEPARRLHAVIGTPRAVVIGLLALSGLILWTWKRLVQGLYIGLTGRASLIKGNVFLTLSLLCVLGPALHWMIGNSLVRVAVVDVMGWLPAVLVPIKMAAAAWVVTRLYRSGLLSDRVLVTGAACWCAAVLALYGVLVWIVSTPLFPRSFLALVAILAIPLARLSAAPLALAWNRHR